MIEIAEEKGIALWVPEPGLPTEMVKLTAVRAEWWRGGTVTGI
jgi:hypothetical protein